MHHADIVKGVAVARRSILENLFKTKFWFKADAVISEQNKAAAWMRVSDVAANAAEGHGQGGAFFAGGMSMVPDGQHIVEPEIMTPVAEEALVAAFTKDIMEQGEELALDENPDPYYSLILGYCLAQKLRFSDARKLAQRILHGKEAGEQEARG